MSLLNAIDQLKIELQQQIIGQEALITRILVAMLADGHLLVEGAPGLAKTKAIQSLAKLIQGKFQRVQFTPDLLPADITGSDIYRPETAEFIFKPGPVFAQLVLADEINRAPAKVQSALLEAMSERQVSVGNTSYKLPEVFMVMATQNPLEQEGTYPLPEAQLDRFLMHVWVDYPNAQSELAIMQLARQEQKAKPMLEATVTPEDIISARKEISQVFMSEAVEQYIIHLTMATREPEKYNAKLAEYLSCGVSPRASIALDRCSRAVAWLNGRDYVTPDDVQMIAPDVFRHRLWLKFEAQAQGVTTNEVLDLLLASVAIA